MFFHGKWQNVQIDFAFKRQYIRMVSTNYRSDADRRRAGGLLSLYEDCGTKFPERHPGFLPIVRQYLEWFYTIRRDRRDHLPVYSSLARTLCGNDLLPFPYNEVRDESPPTGAAKQHVPGGNDKN
jgi:hypothetical protein